MAAWLAAPTQAHAQTDGRPLEPQGFQERFAQSVEVAGNVFVGAVVDGGARRGARSQLTVYGVTRQDQRICVQVTSKDARYRSTFAVPVEGQTGAVTVRFPTRFRAELDALGADDLAPLARVASNNASCEMTRGDLLATSWDRSSAPRAITIFANSLQARMSMTWREESGQGAPPAPCTRLEGVTVAYDMRCALALDGGAPAASASGSCRRIEVLLNRRQGSVRSVEKAYLRLPC